MFRYNTKPLPGRQLNRRHPIGANVVGAWFFNEDAGVLVNDLAGNNNGIVYGASWTRSVHGPVLSFDGINDYINFGAKDIYSPVNMTVFIRMAASIPTIVGTRVFVSKSTIGGLPDDWAFFATSSNYTWRSGGSDNVNVSTAGTNNAGIYNDFCGVRTTKYMAFYFNGVFRGSKGITVNRKSGLLSVGGDAAAGTCYPCTISHLIIVNRICSDPEILSMKQNPYQILKGRTKSLLWTESVVGEPSINVRKHSIFKSPIFRSPIFRPTVIANG